MCRGLYIMSADTTRMQRNRGCFCDARRWVVADVVQARERDARCRRSKMTVGRPQAKELSYYVTAVCFNVVVDGLGQEQGRKLSRGHVELEGLGNLGKSYGGYSYK